MRLTDRMMAVMMTQIALGIRTSRVMLSAGLLMVGLCLTGCVDYKLGIQLDSPNQGQLTQVVRLDNYTNPTAQSFLRQVRQQARSVQGSVKSRSPQELEVTVPFHTAKELEQQFNQFFQGVTNPDLPAIVSHLQIQQRNWLLFEEDRLTFDLDLTSLGLEGTEAFAPSNDLFHLGLSVNEQSWLLKPGQKHHIETVVWMPMPLGWGALGIGAMVVGQQLRQRLRWSPTDPGASA